MKICERGKPCGCAFHTHRQHLFYEFVNLEALAQCNVARHFDADYFAWACAIDDPPLFLRIVQDMNELPRLWEAVKRQGGDLRGACPLF